MNEEVRNAYDEAQISLGETVGAVQHLMRTCEEHNAGEDGGAHLRIEAYLLAHLRSWLS